MYPADRNASGDQWSRRLFFLDGNARRAQPVGADVRPGLAHGFGAKGWTRGDHDILTSAATTPTAVREARPGRPSADNPRSCLRVAPGLALCAIARTGIMSRVAGRIRDREAAQKRDCGSPSTGGAVLSPHAREGELSRSVRPTRVCACCGLLSLCPAEISDQVGTRGFAASCSSIFNANCDVRHVGPEFF